MAYVLSRMAVTWRDVPVFLTWQARLGPPRREWTERFAAEVRLSDFLGETEQELAARLQPLTAELEAWAEIRSERMPNPAMMVRLMARERAATNEADETWWQRMRWPDEAPLPVAGQLISLIEPDDDPERAPQREVVAVRPTFEPGWIEVELRRGS
jgi:hypothetical protein